MGLILESYLNENMFFNSDDVYYNIDNWNKDNNILLITGLSGSGKSTLAREISKENNAILISLDNVSHYIIRDDKKYKTKYSEDEIKILEIFSSKYNDIQFNIQFNNFFDFIFDYAKDNDDKLFILEGIQIINKNMCKFIKDNNIPIIIKGTSATLSFIRQIKRSLSVKSFKIGMGNNPFKSDKWLIIFKKSLEIE